MSFLLQQAADHINDRRFVGEFACCQLGVDQLSIDGQFEATSACRDQLQVADLLLVRREQLARQTDGLWLIVSHRAVFEFQIHDGSSFTFARPPGARIGGQALVPLHLINRRSEREWNQGDRLLFTIRCVFT